MMIVSMQSRPLVCLCSMLYSFELPKRTICSVRQAAFSFVTCMSTMYVHSAQ